MTEYHIARTGIKAGKPVVCKAKQKCKIGNLSSKELSTYRENTRNTYDEETLRQAVQSSTSMNEMFKELGIPHASSTMRRYVKDRLKLNNINYDHLLVKRTKLIFQEGESYYSRDQFLRKMLLAGVKYECQKCGASRQWHGQEITLEIDHIDGNRVHNYLENLRFLCPNCHAQTDTHGMVHSKTINDIRQLNAPVFKKDSCACGREKLVDSEKCLYCYRDDEKGEFEKFRTGKNTPRRGKVQWPADEVLVEMAQNSSWSAVARQFNVSNPTLFVRMKRRGWDTNTFINKGTSTLNTNHNLTVYPVKLMAEAVKYATNYQELFDTLTELEIQNLSYKRMRAALTQNKIDVSHFTKQHTKDVLDRTKINEDILKISEGKNRVKRSVLLRAMVTSDIEYQCKICGNIGEWQGSPLPLAIDHIDGNHYDNRLQNLRFLCPNCHAQQDTSFHSRDKNKKVDKILLEIDLFNQDK